VTLRIGSHGLGLLPGSETGDVLKWDG